MIIKRPAFSILSAFIMCLCFAAVSAAQAPSATPRQEKLLNGLKVLVFKTPAADKVSLKLRVHGGSAFDPQEREGVMKLLSESFFPTEGSRSFFADELGGSFNVTCNYDYIQYDFTSRTGDFVTLIETVAQAMANPELNKESTAALKTALLAQITEVEKDPAYVADREVAKRLFGTFPYGRPEMGSTASIQKIDFADLIFARERLLTADNATLAISGNVDPALVFRAARRYFGAWLKADKKIPSTFRQPDAPKNGLPVVDSPVANTSEFRFAARGLARNDPDFYASKILQKIVENRFRKREGDRGFVRNDPRTLPGSYVFGVSGWRLGIIKKDGNAVALPDDVNSYQAEFLKDSVTQDEFDTVNREWIARLNPDNISELWLDADTYKLGPVPKEESNAKNVSIADVQRVLEKLRKQPFAFVLVFADGGTTSRN
ncbi:MAG: insulinase family protein [Acidobacteria bacterium]|nr:insulinase family protein [Acidobacteriota bacterium]